MQIQIDIPQTINKQLKIYKAENDFDNLQDAVIDILNKKLMRQVNKRRKK